MLRAHGSQKSCAKNNVKYLQMGYPVVMTKIAIENVHLIYSEFSYKKQCFSIAVLDYRMVHPIKLPLCKSLQIP